MEYSEEEISVLKAILENKEKILSIDIPDETKRTLNIVLNLIEKQQKEIEELKENSVSKNSIKELADFAINATNSKDDYSIGMCNGMIYLIATLLNEEPVYKKYEHESIPKEAIREKIKRIKKLDCDIRYDKYDIIDILKELLGE